MKLATEFGSEITIRNLGNGVEASARALLEIMMLNAPQGTELELEAEGEDAAAAVEALAELIERGFGEG
jgi:phosphocarrier protein HPr